MCWMPVGPLRLRNLTSWVGGGICLLVQIFPGFYSEESGPAPSTSSNAAHLRLCQHRCNQCRAASEHWWKSKLCEHLSFAAIRGCGCWNSQLSEICLHNAHFGCPTLWKELFTDFKLFKRHWRESALHTICKLLLVENLQHFLPACISLSVFSGVVKYFYCGQLEL